MRVKFPEIQIQFRLVQRQQASLSVLCCIFSSFTVAQSTVCKCFTTVQLVKVAIPNTDHWKYFTICKICVSDKIKNFFKWIILEESVPITVIYGSLLIDRKTVDGYVFTCSIRWTRTRLSRIFITCEKRASGLSPTSDSFWVYRQLASPGHQKGRYPQGIQDLQAIHSSWPIFACHSRLHMQPFCGEWFMPYSC